MLGLGSLALEGLEAIGEGIASVWNGVKDAVAGMWNGVKGLFATSSTRSTQLTAEMIKDASMQKWIVDMMYRDNNFLKIADELGLDPEMKKLGVNMGKKEKYNELIRLKTEENKNTRGWYTVFHDSEQAVDYIMTKKYFGEMIDAKDAELLMRTLWQANDKPLALEIANTITNNKELFKNQKGLDVNDAKSIKSFANNVAKSACFLNTLFGNIVLSPLNENVPSSMGDMYKTLYEKGMIDDDGVRVKVNINDMSGIQKLVDKVVGENKLEVKGISTGQGKSGTAVYDSLRKISQDPTIATGGVRITGHSILFFNGKTYDTGQPGNPYGPRPYESIITKWADEKKISSVYLLFKK